MNLTDPTPDLPTFRYSPQADTIVVETEFYQAALRPHDVQEIAAAVDAYREAHQDTPEAVTAQAAGPTLQVSAITYENMGDSAVFARKPVAVKPGETVTDLVARALRLGGSSYSGQHPGDRVEIQVIPEEPKPAANPWPESGPMRGVDF